MTTQPDIVIIGSGIGGSTMAAALAPTGAKIVILEAGDHLPGVHAGLEHFERHLAADRLGLLGHEHNAKSPFADLLQQFIRTDHHAGPLQDGLLDSAN